MVAHISEDGAREQSVLEHNLNVGRIASRLLERVGLAKCGLFAGEFHDMGKSTQAFNDYIRFGGARGSVIHTFQSVKYLLDRYHDGKDALAAEVLAYACGAHHGLFDCVDVDERNGFDHRVNHAGMNYAEAVRNFEATGYDRRRVDEAFHAAADELGILFDVIADLSGLDDGGSAAEGEMLFYVGLLVRLVLSAVVDADRRDTANFMTGMEFPDVMSDGELEALWTELSGNVERYVASLDKHDAMSAARRDISDACRLHAESECGVFRFKAPCGGGKTLASAVFATRHALSGHPSSRVIFSAPWLSILDQNAGVLKSAFGRRDIVLECHSNVVNDRRVNSEDYKSNYKQLSETWESPVVVTTSVQLLDVLFDGSMHSIRRFHSLCGSIIVIDEVQAIPTRMSTLFALAVNFLVRVCGASVVLCSATQPCFEEIEHGIRVPITDLCPAEYGSNPVFIRTRVVDDGMKSLEAIADSVVGRSGDVGSVLVVCNKKTEAAQLYGMVSGRVNDAYHLSASMCQAHREFVISKMEKKLSDKTMPLVCISTQVVEAGVDLSFGSVVRLFTGLDSVVQAAGRCNRHGELGMGTVHLVRCEGEKLAGLPDIERAQAAMNDFLSEFEAHPERFGGRLDSDESVSEYYRILYGRRMLGGYQDYLVRELDTTVYEMLSGNGKFCKFDPGYCLRQAFRTAGERFHVLEGGRVDVIMDYKAGVNIIADLKSERSERDVRFLIDRLKAAKRYTVSLFERDVKRLGNEIIPLNGGAYGLFGHYDGKLGFVLDKNDMRFAFL